MNNALNTTTTKRISSLALAAFFTVAILLGVNTLASVDTATAPQLATSSSTAHS